MTTLYRKTSTFLQRAARLTAVAAVGIVLGLATVAPYAPAEAAPKAGFGSRGTRTFQAPPSTTTAPRTAQPIERTAAQPGGLQPGATGARPGGFMSGFGGTMLKGLLVGGLIGALLGSGFGGLAGILGLVLQVALIGGAIYLALRFFRSRQPQPAHAAAGGPLQRDAAPLGGMMGGLGGSSGLGQAPAGPAPYAPAASGPSDAVGLEAGDFDAFERLLGEIQTAFGQGDLARLAELTTPEAHGFLAEQTRELTGAGLVNEIRDVKLLRGDLAEAWREGATDFATVALHFSMIDATRERASGRVVEGDAVNPTELTQLWTFVRERSFGRPGPWRLSAMQDA